MNLEERLQNVAVIGAAGKMGSGIAALLVREMALLKLKPEFKEVPFHLHLIDNNPAALPGLHSYLHGQLVRVGEKAINQLRAAFADRSDLVENGDVIQEFVTLAESIILPGTAFEGARDARLVFEAVSENVDLKSKLLTSLKNICGDETWFLTNTSSIPIHVIDEQAGLDGRIVGYHFYNPPVVQKLLELIPARKSRPELIEQSKDLAQRLGKIVVPANDIAGFIGNGFFLRDGLFALSEVERLQEEEGWSETQALYAMNRVTQEWLIRPMGIFQLIDYVGVDVFRSIMKTMDHYIENAEFRSELLDDLVARNITGGQHANGSQKDGILAYQKGRPVAIYDRWHNDYRQIDADGWSGETDHRLGDLPASWKAWKVLLTSARREEMLAGYFRDLHAASNVGCILGQRTLRHARDIGIKLKQDGVADKIEDVNQVMTNGFYHLYGPVNDYSGSPVSGCEE